MTLLTVVSDQKHCDLGSGTDGCPASFTARRSAAAANDAVSKLRDYVQISNFVTKVLIYKRLRR